MPTYRKADPSLEGGYEHVRVASDSAGSGSSTPGEVYARRLVALGYELAPDDTVAPVDQARVAAAESEASRVTPTPDEIAEAEKVATPQRSARRSHADVKDAE